MMTSRLFRVLVIGAALFTACKKGNYGPGPKGTPPKGTVILASLPQGTDFSKLAAKVSEFGGPGPMVSASVGTMAAQGLGFLVTAPADLQFEAPMHLLLVGPVNGGGVPPLVFVARAEDGKKVQAKEGFEVAQSGNAVVVATKGKLDAYKSFGLSLAKEKPGDGILVRMWPAEVKKAFAEQIAQGMQALKASPGAINVEQMLEGYAEVGRGVEKHAQYVDLRLLRDGHAPLEVVIVPKTKGLLREFAKLQKPHDFKLSNRAPPMPEMNYYFEGNMAMGPMFDALMTWAQKVMPQFAAPEYFEAFRVLRDVSTGEIFGGMKISFGSAKSSSWFGIGTNGSSQGAFLNMWRSLRGKEADVFGMKQKYDFRENIDKIQGRPVHEVITVTEMAVPLLDGESEMRQVNRFVELENWIVMSQGTVLGEGFSAPDLATVAGAVTGKGSADNLSKVMKKGLERAKSRKASVAVLIDLGALPGARLPVKAGMFTIGGTEKELVFGIDVF